MLPAVFRIDDPVLALDLDPVHTQKLHRLVTELDAEVFEAEDSLGWTYQFWRAAEKQAVNDSGVKIGADELPAVTQLFTEPYMVRFLLHNTLGAWWAGKVLAANPVLAQTAVDEDALRATCSLPDYSFEMLRFVREGEDGPWRPAAGTFPGWPKEAKAITMLDPCCGSGHFLTEALAILTALRQVEERHSAAEAVGAVLRENLHGLEIDGRCVQIAAFAVALTAWRIGGWQTLPLPQIAWVGAPPPLPKRDFVALALGDAELEYALAALYDLFVQAPVLGTLLETSGGDLFEAAKMREVERLLQPLLERARKAEPEEQEGTIAALGMADAASLLAQKYTLQATNVPFLGKSKQGDSLSSFVERNYPNAKADLATVMIMRMLKLLNEGGAIAAVSGENWWYLGSYEFFRSDLLSKRKLVAFASLGANAFETPMYAFNVGLTVIGKDRPSQNEEFFGLDAHKPTTPSAKNSELRSGSISILKQGNQLKNPDSRITLEEFSDNNPLLSTVAESYQGIRTGDRDRFVFAFWEVNNFAKWEPYRNSKKKSDLFSGITEVIKWDQGAGELHQYASDTRDKLHDMHESGNRAWGRVGVAINQMGELRYAAYLGEKFDGNVTVLVPHKPELAPAILAYCSHPEFTENVRRIDRKLAVTNATLTKVPFDRSRWEIEASTSRQNRTPEPETGEPNEWYFHGHPS